MLNTVASIRLLTVLELRNENDLASNNRRIVPLQERDTSYTISKSAHNYQLLEKAVLRQCRDYNNDDIDLEQNWGDSLLLHSFGLKVKNE
jgi:hypothetical protein